MKIEVIATGSKGNCFLFNDSVIIDMGLPMSRLKSVDFEKVTHILLTHIHGDHFNETTIRNIHSKHKHIVFICGEWLKERLRLVFGGNLDKVEVIEMNRDELYQFGELRVAGFHAPHNVPNCGYRLVDSKGHKHFHVTDISSFIVEKIVNGKFVIIDGEVVYEQIVARNYDSATIECNYEDNRANELIDEVFHIRGAMRNHLSVYETVEFIQENNIKELIPVHISSKTGKEVIQYLDSVGLVRDEVIKKLREEFS